MRVVKWVDLTPEEAASKPDDDTPGSAQRTQKPGKKKVIEVEPEPPFTPIDESTRDLELLVSGLCDYSKMKCKIESIHFKDTLMFQTRVFRY